MVLDSSINVDSVEGSVEVENWAMISIITSLFCDKAMRVSVGFSTKGGRSYLDISSFTGGSRLSGFSTDCSDPRTLM